MPDVTAGWVVARYTNDRLRSVRAHKESAIGYYEFGEGLVAFRFVKNGPIPEHLVEVVDPNKIGVLEKRRLLREGHESHQVTKASDSAIHQAKLAFESHKKLSNKKMYYQGKT